MKKTRKIANGKGFLNISECMQIPPSHETNCFSLCYIGYYVGTSFRPVRCFEPTLDSDPYRILLETQVDFDKPLFLVYSQVYLKNLSTL